MKRTVSKYAALPKSSGGLRKELKSMSEFLFFIIGTMLGGTTGVVIMCLMQINRLSKREEGMYEETKRADTVPTDRGRS